MARRSRSSFAAVAVVASAMLSIASTAQAAGPTKEQCVEAHSKGQDARDAGEVSLARKLFLTCAQSTCPTVIQGDCARFSEDLDKLQPSVSFAARDANQADLPDTTVYVDGVLFATRLDDGKTHDVDPGRHTVKFVNGSREFTTTLIINQGEKARAVVATFGGGEKAPALAAQPDKAPAPAPAEPRRSATPLVFVGIGGALIAGGVAMSVVGLSKVPANCSLSSHDCSAPPGDSSFSTASSAVTIADVGIGVGVAGAAVLTSSLIWYFKSPKIIQQGTLVTPWFGDRAGGIAVRGEL